MIKKEILTGFVVGLIANSIGLYFSATLLGESKNVIMVLKTASAEEFLGKLISIGAILNLAAFFIFIRIPLILVVML